MITIQPIPIAAKSGVQQIFAQKAIAFGKMEKFIVWAEASVDDVTGEPDNKYQIDVMILGDNAVVPANMTHVESIFHVGRCWHLYQAPA